MTYRLLVTGSRDWDDVLAITQQFANLRGWLSFQQRDPLDVVVVHGDCPTGADLIAKSLALMFGWTDEPHPAQWNRQPDGTYDASAGFRRNTEMVNSGVDSCLAFIKNGSRGATHCSLAARTAGIPTRVITEGGET